MRKPWTEKSLKQDAAQTQARQIHSIQPFNASQKNKTQR
ncbi:hypothetical protein APED_16095 [Acanthopleuribacter pedis]